MPSLASYVVDEIRLSSPQGDFEHLSTASSPRRQATYIRVCDLAKHFNVDLIKLNAEIEQIKSAAAKAAQDPIGQSDNNSSNQAGELNKPEVQKSDSNSDATEVFQGLPELERQDAGTKESADGKHTKRKLDLPPGGFNLCVLVGKVEVVVDKFRVDQSRVRLAEVLVGDETGSVYLRARDDQIDTLQEISDMKGAVVLRNSTIELYQGRHLRLAITKWGKLCSYPDDVESTPSPPLSIKRAKNYSIVDLNLVVAEAPTLSDETSPDLSPQTQHQKQKRISSQYGPNHAEGFDDNRSIRSHASGQRRGGNRKTKHGQPFGQSPYPPYGVYPQPAMIPGLDIYNPTMYPSAASVGTIDIAQYGYHQKVFEADHHRKQQEAMFVQQYHLQQRHQLEQMQLYHQQLLQSQGRIMHQSPSPHPSPPDLEHTGHGASVNKSVPYHTSQGPQPTPHGQPTAPFFAEGDPPRNSPLQTSPVFVASNTYQAPPDLSTVSGGKNDKKDEDSDTVASSTAASTYAHPMGLWHGHYPSTGSDTPPISPSSAQINMNPRAATFAPTFGKGPGVAHPQPHQQVLSPVVSYPMYEPMQHVNAPYGASVVYQQSGGAPYVPEILEAPASRQTSSSGICEDAVQEEEVGTPLAEAPSSEAQGTSIKRPSSEPTESSEPN